MKHTPQQCGIKDSTTLEQCKQEAAWWVYLGDESLPYAEGMNVYLCADHMVEVSDDEGESYNHIDGRGVLIKRIIGGYSCHDKCQECNPLINGDD